MDPIPRDVGLFVTEPDNGQHGMFFGDDGLLQDIVLQGVDSDFAKAVAFSHDGGIRRVFARHGFSVFAAQGFSV